MSDFRAVRPDQIVYALQRAGFYIPRNDGIHTYLRRHRGQPERLITVRSYWFLNGDRDLKRGTVSAVLREAGLTPNELRGLL
jgi:predicted RNA binding protein YcfA (HicA-like mRNA interferase family)